MFLCCTCKNGLCCWFQGLEAGMCHHGHVQPHRWIRWHSPEGRPTLLVIFLPLNCHVTKPSIVLEMHRLPKKCQIEVSGSHCNWLGVKLRQCRAAASNYLHRWSIWWLFFLFFDESIGCLVYKVVVKNVDPSSRCRPQMSRSVRRYPADCLRGGKEPENIHIQSTRTIFGAPQHEAVCEPLWIHMKGFAHIIF